MKTNPQPSLFARISSLKVVSGDISGSLNQHRSPYLKAILTGQSSLGKSASNNATAIANPDREAALRYIRESKKLKK